MKKVTYEKRITEPVMREDANIMVKDKRTTKGEEEKH